MSDTLRLEGILEGIIGGFFALNGNYEITYWNRAAEAGTGLKSVEVLGKNVFDVFPNAAGATLGEKYRLAMDTKTFQSFETSYKDERFEAWYDVRIYPADDGISVFFQDITEKKRNQRQKEVLVEISKTINSARHLDELCVLVAEKIATLFEIPSWPVCVYLFDPRGNEVRLVAPDCIEEEFSREVVHQMVEPASQHLPAQAAYLRETVLSDQIHKSTVAAMRIDEMKAANFQSLIVTPLIVQGELQGILELPSIKQKDFVAPDIEILSVIANELAGGMIRRRLVDELRSKNLELESQTQKALEASDTLKKFLATFSHELRSPLNSIIGFSELIVSQFKDLSPESILEFMRNITTSGQHLQQIINDILDLSKIEAGKLDLHIASYPVAYFRESVERVLAGIIKEKSINLQFELSQEFDEIVVDQTRFKQILINIIANAIKFSPPGATVKMSMQRVGNDIQFEIHDNGIGIKPEEIAMLFKPFRQAVSGRDMNRQGLGLGLAITKKLVELHGGSIWIASEWQQGTTVSFKIPMIVDATSEKILQAGMLLDALERENFIKDPNIKPLALIVEDSVQAAELLQLYIESAGYRVEVARDGVQAVDMAKRLQPNVITLDLMIPVKDGWQVLKELKRHPLCKNIPIIIVSIVDEKNLGFSLGAVDYFVKPVNKQELLQAIERVHILPKPGNHCPRVLVIDDDRAATDLIQVILENEGYQVLKAFQGKDGVEIAAREHPDIIILDIIMPEMSGFNVAYQLKHIPATRSIPIIVLTSMEIDENTQAQLGTYVSGLMSKSSFTKRDLLREITNIESLK